jgi:hypothetical protein
MATKFYFDFRDIFRAGRLGFRGKKMMMHFLGLMLGYVIYEALTYLSLIGNGIAKDFWQSYGLRPVFFIAGKLPATLPLVTIILMALGVLIWLIIYYLFSTAVAKVAIEELRGDDFYSMRDALKFALKHWKSVYIAMLALIGIFIFCLFWPTLVGLLDLIPYVDQAAMHFGSWVTTFLTIPVYFIGLFMVLLAVAFLFGIVLVPSIVAVTGEDTFETIYQLFSTIWNQPWRLVVYELLLKFVKVLGFAIFAALSVAGMYMAFLPSAILAKQESYYFADVIARSLRIIGVDSDLVARLVPNAQLGVSMPWTLDLATFFFFASLIMIGAIVLSYFLSMMSCGYTILYVILRKKTTDENMLEVEKEEESRMGVEEKTEEPEEEPEKPEEKEETEEKPEEAAEEPEEK